MPPLTAQDVEAFQAAYEKYRKTSFEMAQMQRGLAMATRQMQRHFAKAGAPRELKDWDPEAAYEGADLIHTVSDWHTKLAEAMSQQAGALRDVAYQAADLFEKCREEENVAG